MKIIDLKILYKLKLGEVFCPNSNSSWQRVPGGWTYGDMQGTCFVPFSNEFQNAPESTVNKKRTACSICKKDMK